MVGGKRLGARVERLRPGVAFVRVACKAGSPAAEKRIANGDMFCPAESTVKADQVLHCLGDGDA